MRVISAVRGNFLLGVVLGSILTLTVNILTTQYQDLLQRQRVLESIENEIALNEIQASNIDKANTDKLKKNEQPNLFSSSSYYSNQEWLRNEAIKYVVHQDATTQARLTTYYTTQVVQNNLLLSRYFSLTQPVLSQCYLQQVSSSDQSKCLSYYQQYLRNEQSVAKVVKQESAQVLQVFHPTQDRLNSWFLKLLFGDKAVKFLSGN